MDCGHILLVVVIGEYFAVQFAGEGPGALSHQPVVGAAGEELEFPFEGVGSGAEGGDGAGHVGLLAVHQPGDGRNQAAGDGPGNVVHGEADVQRIVVSAFAQPLGNGDENGIIRLFAGGQEEFPVAFRNKAVRGAQGEGSLAGTLGGIAQPQGEPGLFAGHHGHLFGIDQFDHQRRYRGDAEGGLVVRRQRHHIRTAGPGGSAGVFGNFALQLAGGAVEFLNFRASFENLVAEGGNGGALVHAHDVIGKHQILADGPGPAFFDGIHVDETQNGPQSGTGAVRVVAQRGGGADGLAEISAARQPGQQDQGQIDGHVRPVVAGIFFQNLRSHLQRVVGFVPPGDGIGEGGGHAAIAGDVGKTLFDEPTAIGFHEGVGFHRRQKQACVHAVVKVIGGCVFPGQRNRQIGIRRRQAGPQLAANGRAHARAELAGIFAGKGREQADGGIVVGHAVFVRAALHVLLPQFAQIMRRNRQAPAAQDFQRHHLQIQIVVGHHGGGHRVVIGHFVDVQVAFKGHAQGAAHGFADEAAPDFFAIFAYGIVHVFPPDVGCITPASAGGRRKDTAAWRWNTIPNCGTFPR